MLEKEKAGSAISHLAPASTRSMPQAVPPRDLGGPTAAWDALAGHIGHVFHIAWGIRLKRLTVAQSSRPDFFSGGERLALLKEPRRPADAVRQVGHAPRELTRRHHLSSWRRDGWLLLLRPGAPDRVLGGIFSGGGGISSGKTHETAATAIAPWAVKDVTNSLALLFSETKAAKSQRCIP